MDRKITSNSPAETFELGIELGKQIAAGDVVLLFGGLGAGKTLLTKGIAEALGVDAHDVTSPSFTLVNLYKAELVDVYHIDLWRLPEGTDTATNVGLHEILDAEAAVTIIEWPDRLLSTAWPNRTFRISVDGDGDEPRTITVEICDKDLTSAAS